MSSLDETALTYVNVLVGEMVIEPDKDIRRWIETVVALGRIWLSGVYL
jgi:hypothetical protein